jgi:hypothetical protein
MLGALLFDDSQLKADALDDAARFKENLSDWKDIFSDVDEPGRLEAERSLIEELRSIERLGYVARYGSYDPEFEFARKWTKMPTAVITFFERRDWVKVSMKTMAVPRRFGAFPIPEKVNFHVLVELVDRHNPKAPVWGSKGGRWQTKANSVPFIGRRFIENAVLAGHAGTSRVDAAYIPQ